MAEKKYYWLKLKEDFFRNKEIKKLRRIAGGDTYTIIYLKMQLLSIKNDGKIYFDGIEASFAEELALELDESAEDVKLTIAFLQANSLLEQVENDEFYLNRVPETIGKETAAAERMRRVRKSKSVTMFAPVTKCYTEIEIEKELDIEKDIDITSPDGDKSPTKASRIFKPPSLEELQAYVATRKIKIDAENFIDYYAARGWMLNKTKMKDWKAAVRTWERNEKERKPQNKSGNPFKDILRELENEHNGNNRTNGNNQNSISGILPEPRRRD